MIMTHQQEGLIHNRLAIQSLNWAINFDYETSTSIGCDEDDEATPPLW